MSKERKIRSLRCEHLTLVVLLLFSFKLAHAQQDQVQQFSGYLEKHEVIKPDDKSTILQMTREMISAGTYVVPFTDMSPVRKSNLSMFFEDMLSKYPQDDYNTPLQREAYIESFRFGLESYFMYPVFRQSDPEKVEMQTNKFIESSKSWLSNSYPEFMGTSISEEILSAITTELKRRVADDMIPAFKHALSNDELSKALYDVEQIYITTPPRLVYPSGWDEYDDLQKKDYLNTNAERIAGRLTNVIRNLGISSLMSHYSMSANEKGIFKNHTLPFTAGDPRILHMHELVNRAAEERKLIDKEIVERDKQEFESMIRETKIRSLGLHMIAERSAQETIEDLHIPEPETNKAQEGTTMERKLEVVEVDANQAGNEIIGNIRKMDTSRYGNKHVLLSVVGAFLALGAVAIVTIFVKGK
ncbi:MAG: hypothetical protein GY845_26235 [Planctomycetes bacterium]|nr:hypothetical protein [Planctomycetota bacterium]